MALSQSEAVAQTRRMIEWRSAEQTRLEMIRKYVKDEQKLDWLPSDTPSDLRRIARLSRVNVCGFIVDSSAQSLFVDGLLNRDRQPEGAWDLWRANRWNKRQLGVHRAALQYGASYAIVLPGDPVPVMRGVSPRNMTVVYGADDEWPMWALEQRRSEAAGTLWRLFDDEEAYWVGGDPSGGADGLRFISSEVHGFGHVPVIRYRETDNLDDDNRGIVEPLFTLQDQINVTTFLLHVAQHYGAHGQRYVMGWMAGSAEEKLKATASRLWTFEDPDTKVGEFAQTSLDGYVASREATLRHVATISQTPVHELLGSLANLSAEALVAARDSHNRKLKEHRTSLGESHEQTLQAASMVAGLDYDPTSWVRWRDMDDRAIAQIADALGKFAQMLGIPKEALWDRAADAIGAQQDEVESWRRMATEGDSIGQLTELLAQQMGDG